MWELDGAGRWYYSEAMERKMDQLVGLGGTQVAGGTSGVDTGTGTFRRRRYKK